VELNTLIASLEINNLRQSFCVSVWKMCFCRTCHLDDEFSALLPSANFSSLAASYFPELEWRNDAYGAHKHIVTGSKKRNIIYVIYCATSVFAAQIIQANVIFCILCIHSDNTLR
jgi:hypothetical protein